MRVQLVALKRMENRRGTATEWAAVTLVDGERRVFFAGDRFPKATEPSQYVVASVGATTTADEAKAGYMAVCYETGGQGFSLYEGQTIEVNENTYEEVIRG